MIRIERLRLRLPARQQAQAQTIARRIADTLAAAGPQTAQRIASLQVPTIRVDAAAQPAQIADQAAQSILQQLRGQPNANR